MTSTRPVLHASGLRKTFGSGAALVRAVDGVDLDVAPGETVGIMGPSGCGKSTLLHLLGGLERPSAGTIELAGQPVSDRSERALARTRARELLGQVGLADRTGFLPSALSGGQRQRVAIARALINRPMIVLADEPTGNLDSSATVEVLRLFEALHESGQTLVIVTHDQRVAATADRLISMRDGAFVDETRMTGGSGGNLAKLIGLGGE